MADSRVPPALRQKIAELAEGCCEYCRTPERFAFSAFDMDHIISRSRGGTTEFGNLALACHGCNAHKHSRTAGLDPVAGDTVPFFHPRRNRWWDHFAWDDHFTMIIGLSPTGRATVEALKLNRFGLVNLRRALRQAGEYPPADHDR